METPDAFGGGVEIGNEDPFDGTDFGDFGEEPSESAAQSAEPTNELKTVDKEGNEVQPEPDLSGGHPTMSPEAAAANAAAYEERTMGTPAHVPNDGAQGGSQDGSAAEPESPVDTPQQAAPAPAEAAEAAVEAQQGEDPQPAEAGTTSSAAEPSPTTPPAGDGSADPTPASSPESGGSEATGDEEEAPLPEERQTNGKTTHRRYYVLRVDGPGKFTQVSWHEDADGKMVPKGTTGSKRQTVALARGTEDALKLGFAAVGSPQDGAQLVAVAALHFQPRKVRPKPPEPSRQRLQIS